MDKPKKCEHRVIYVREDVNTNTARCATRWCNEIMNIRYLLNWEWAYNIDHNVYERLPRRP